MNDDWTKGLMGSTKLPSEQLSEHIQKSIREVMIPKDHTMADTMYDRIARAIKDFEDDLEPNEEVGAYLAQFGQAMTITVEDVTFRNPNLVEIHGTNAAGERCTLVQHMSQVNILLVATKAKQDPPNRIGFKLVAEATSEGEAPKTESAKEGSE